jgi:hypothetical protein
VAVVVEVVVGWWVVVFVEVGRVLPVVLSERYLPVPVTPSAASRILVRRDSAAEPAFVKRLLVRGVRL